MLDVMSCINEFKKKGVNMYFTKCDSLKINNENELMNNILLSGLAIASEIERSLISERTKNALAYKKTQGIVGGRKKGEFKLNGKEEEIKKLLADGYKMTALAEKYKCTDATFSNFVKCKNLKPKKEVKKKTVKGNKNMDSGIEPILEDNKKMDASNVPMPEIKI